MYIIRQIKYYKNIISDVISHNKSGNICKRKLNKTSSQTQFLRVKELRSFWDGESNVFLMINAQQWNADQVQQHSSFNQNLSWSKVIQTTRHHQTSSKYSSLRRNSRCQNSVGKSSNRWTLLESSSFPGAWIPRERQENSRETVSLEVFRRERFLGMSLTGKADVP